jgi:hypothetical protein
MADNRISKSAMVTAGACVASAAVVAASFVVIPKFSGRAAPPRFAVVDLASIVRTNQQLAVSRLAEKGVDQAARASSLALAREFGQRLDLEVRELSIECGCVLLMREAVVAGELEDLTPALLNRLAKK